jgi:hypothetical protein
MNMYSNRAIPQLRATAMYHFLSLRFRRCPYQAKVMKTFEMISNDAVLRRIIVMVYVLKIEVAER